MTGSDRLDELEPGSADERVATELIELGAMPGEEPEGHGEAPEGAPRSEAEIIAAAASLPWVDCLRLLLKAIAPGLEARRSRWAFRPGEIELLATGCAPLAEKILGDSASPEATAVIVCSIYAAPRLFAPKAQPTPEGSSTDGPARTETA